MNGLLQMFKERWEPQPTEPPAVDARFPHMNGIQRATESIRYVLLRWEHWVSPSGDIREWLRHNTRIGACLLIPGIFVMPVIGLILWQVSGWLSLLTSIAGRLVVLSIFVLLAFVVIIIVRALSNR